MGEDHYDEGQDMMDIDFSELNRDRRTANGRSRKKPSDPEKGKKLLVFYGTALCVAILIIVIILFSVDKSGKKTTTPIEAQVKALEQKVANLGRIKQDITPLQTRQETLEKAIAKLEGSLKSLRRDLHKINREFVLLKKRGVVRKRSASQTRHRYHMVQKGDSPYKIARRYGISMDDLYRLNNLTKKSLIYPGQKLVVGPVGKK